MDDETVRRVRELVAGVSDELVALSHAISADPELAYDEHRAAERCAVVLEQHGLAVERGAYGLPTAFAARAGSRGPHVVVCAEYDALPEVGHACGHNIIAASGVGAGIALAALADEVGLRVTVLGTPAEEVGGGKVDLIMAGALEGVDAAMMVDPAPMTHTRRAGSRPRVGGRRHGQARPTPARAPTSGATRSTRSSPATPRSRCCVSTFAGTSRCTGSSPMAGRRPTSSPSARPRLTTCGPSIARTSTTCAYACGRALKVRGPRPGPRSRSARCRTRTSRSTRTQGLVAAFGRACDLIGRPYTPDPEGDDAGGSTDFGNISQLVPAVHADLAVHSWPAVNHQREFAAHCVTAAGDRTMLEGAMALALTAVAVAHDPSILAAVPG